MLGEVENNRGTVPRVAKLHGKTPAQIDFVEMEVVFLADVQKSLTTAEQLGGNFHVSTVSLISLISSRMGVSFRLGVSFRMEVSTVSPILGVSPFPGLEFPAGFGREFLRAMLTIALRIAEMNAVGRRHGRIRESVVASRGKRRSAEMARGLEFHQHQL